jgi:GTP-binding protein HflX
VLCSDTVGFVRKLPHLLVDAFHATLEVVGTADLLVHVVDGSAPDPIGQMEAVQSVLSEIGANDVPELVAVNKVDLAPREVARLAAQFPGAVAFSALTGRGVSELLRTIGERLRAFDRTVELSVPVGRGDVVAALHRQGEVLDESYDGEAVAVRARLDEEGIRRFEEFMKR